MAICKFFIFVFVSSLMAFEESGSLMEAGVESRGRVLLYVWGSGLRRGGAGRGAILWTPRPVPSFDSTENICAGVACSQRRMLAWTAAGDTFVWRQNDGKRPTRDINPRANEPDAEVADWVRAPDIIHKAGDERTGRGFSQETYFVIGGSTNDQASLALARPDAYKGPCAMYSWGLNSHGELGLGDKKQRNKPTLVKGFENDSVAAVALGQEHATCVSEGGLLYAWGDGQCGRLGHGDEEFSLVPKLVKALSRHTITGVACGLHHTAAVTRSGEVYTWGKGTNGRLGHGNSKNEHHPRIVEVLDGSPVMMVSCGEAHTVVVDSANSVWSWGWNAYSQLGLGDIVDRNSPAAVRPKSYKPAENKQKSASDYCWTKINQISCGQYHCVASGGGGVYSWGYGEYGALGHGVNRSEKYPRKVVAIEGDGFAIEAHSGGDFSAAIVRVVVKASPMKTIPKLESLKVSHIEGSEIELVRELKSLEGEIKTIKSNTKMYSSIMEQDKMDNMQVQCDAQEWDSLINQLEAQIKVQENRKRTLAQAKSADALEAQRPTAARVAELKMYLGLQEDSLLKEQFAMKEAKVKLERLERQKNEGGMIKPILDEEELEKELLLSTKIVEAELEETKKLHDAMEILKLENKNTLDTKAALMRKETNKQVEEIKAMLGDPSENELYKKLYNEEEELLALIEQEEAEMKKIQEDALEVETSGMPLLRKEFKDAKRKGEAAVIKWEKKRVKKTALSHEVLLEKRRLDNMRRDNAEKHVILTKIKNDIEKQHEEAMAESEVFAKIKEERLIKLEESRIKREEQEGIRKAEEETAMEEAAVEEAAAKEAAAEEAAADEAAKKEAAEKVAAVEEAEAAAEEAAIAEPAAAEAAAKEEEEVARKERAVKRKADNDAARVEREAKADAALDDVRLPCY